MSNRCVYFTASPQDRHLDYLKRHQERRNNLLALMLETNHACVHPANPNYVREVGDGSDLIWWAKSNGLLSKQDERDLEAPQRFY